MPKLFEVGAMYPPQKDLERLAKYARGKAIFDGRQYEIAERASELLKDTPHAAQLDKLYIAVNIIDTLLFKPADLMIGERPTYESGLPDASTEQKRLNSIIEENDVNTLIPELVVGGGYRGDSWIKTYYGRRVDVTEIPDGLDTPDVPLEPIIEAVDAAIVFPELSRGSRKRFKAINIAYIEWVDDGKEEIPFLNVERHVPGYIIYERFRLEAGAVDSTFGVPISTYKIVKQVATGRENGDVEPTGISTLLVDHIPYKTVDDRWQGISGVEKLESVLAAINDRLVQIDYVLWKHSDPTAYGPDLDTATNGATSFMGRYITIDSNDAKPGYMTWESQLEGAFKELDILLGIVYQMSETPQWLFGTTLASDKGGTGTSHTDSGAIKARFMPILSKVKRIRNYVDRAIRDALYKAQQLEIFANEGVDGFESYEAQYPTIQWKDGIPRDEKEMAEVAQIRTGGKATWSVRDAIKKLDEVDDEKAAEIIARIDDDETRVNGTVDSSIFNGGGGGGA